MSNSAGNHSALALGLGVGTWSDSGVLLEVWFPVVLHRPSNELTQQLHKTLTPSSGYAEPDARQLTQLIKLFDDSGLAEVADTTKLLAESNKKAIVVLLTEDTKLANAAEAYLKLHLLSLRYAAPNTLDLTNIFSVMPNVVWTSEGAILPAELPGRMLQSRVQGRQLTVDSIDKFPRMTNYVLPSGVRIADASRIRLGAHLGSGTTVMHEGFVNFNAGTLGSAMVEGRISQGVTLGENSDLGGGASTMGTLAGGGGIVISIGQSCLIGANAGTGIPLGDRCTIEAGLYITAGTLVAVVDQNKQLVQTVKARELAGQSDMLFIRNSETGRIECRTNRVAGELNTDLHTHN